MQPAMDPATAGLLADLVVVIHLAFVAFAVGGGLAVAWRPRLAWLHLPALAWAAAVMAFGWTCPLTPLEKRLRALAGETPYEGGFVQRYLEPVLYPPGLTRDHQVALAAALVALNGALYAGALRRRRR